MIPKRAKKKDQTTKRLGKLLKTLHLVGCGLRTVFCFKTFLPNEGRTSANGRRRGWQTNKQKKNITQVAHPQPTRKKRATKRQTPATWMCARACFDSRVRAHVVALTVGRAAVRKLETQNQKERTHGKRQNINRFLIVVIIFFSKNERFFTILIKFDKNQTRERPPEV